VEDVIFPTTISSESEQARPAIDSQNQLPQGQPIVDANSTAAPSTIERANNEHSVAAPRYPHREHKLPKRYCTDNVTFVLQYCTHSLDLVLFLVGRSVVYCIG